MKSELQKKTLAERLTFLNQSYKENVTDIFTLFDSEKEEFEGICAECFGQTEQKTAGDEGWTVCPCCQTVEGKTYEITSIPSLDVAYNWNTKQWSQIDPNLGDEG